MEPLVKWIGGKRWIAKNLAQTIRHHLSDTGTYFEPFAGSAAVFFELHPEQAVLCDMVWPLMATYRHVSEDSMNVWKQMKAVKELGEHNYNLRRFRFNRLMSTGKSSVELAALFLYLNRACFNGLWRQNENGEFNVPYGKYKRINLPSLGTLMQAAGFLQEAELHVSSLPETTFQLIQRAKAGDVIFSDPPYFGAFDNYEGLFNSDKEFQSELARVLWKAKDRGVVVFAMNRWCKETIKWYGSFADIKQIVRSQSVAGTVEGRKPWSQLLATAIP